MAVLGYGYVPAQSLDLRDITKGTFRGESMAAVKPLSDGESYAQLSSDGQRIEQYSFKTGKQIGVLFDSKAAKGATIDEIEDYIVSPDGQRLLIQTQSKRIYRHSFTANYYIYTVRNNRLAPLSENGPQQTPLFSPDGLQIAFVRDNNIFIIKLLYDNAEVQITKDGKRNEVINGIPDWVNEEEFGLARSMAFTSDSKQLVWVRYDEKAVKEFSMPMFKGLKPEREEYADYPGAYTYKYPIAGEENSKVTVWSFDISSRQTRQLQLPLGADDYVPRLKMTSQPQQVAVYTLNRHQDCLRIFMCNPLSTVCKQVIEEKVSKYVKEEAMDGIQITDRHILVPSDRSGWMHLYLYNHNGQLLRQVDDGNYEVSDVYGYDETTGNVYYASHENGATDQRVWVSHQNGKRECLTPKAGWNMAIFSKDFKYFIHTWSTIDTPPVYSLCNNTGKELTTLIDNKKLQQQLGRVRSTSVQSAEAAYLSTQTQINDFQRQIRSTENALSLLIGQAGQQIQPLRDHAHQGADGGGDALFHRALEYADFLKGQQSAQRDYQYAYPFDEAREREHHLGLLALFGFLGLVRQL